MKLLPLIVSAAVGLGPYMARATCNVASSQLELETLISGSFSQYNDDELKIVKAAELKGSKIELTAAADPGTITAAWFLQLQRMADGFAATFDFQISGGNADGFAFVVQNDRTINTVSDGGSALGFSDAVSAYFAVGFDVCQSRASGNCNTEQMFFESKTSAGTISRSATKTLTTSIKDGKVHTATVEYLVDVDQVVITLDTGDSLTASGVPSLEDDVLNSKFAFFGFTASNSFVTGSAQLTAATIDVNDLKIVQMNSGTRLDADSLVPKQVDFGKTVTYHYFLVDSCNDPLADAQVPDFATQILPNIVATLTAQDLNRDPVTPTSITQNPDQKAEIFIVFVTPVGVEAKWDLEITFDGVLAQKNPVVGVLDTNIPSAGGLKPLGIGLLSALIAVLVVAVIMIVRGLNNYRKKLKEHKEDIEYGKTKQEVDRIDKTIEYNMNPMVAPLDKLKERLAANEKVIEQLKAGQKDAMDSDYTVQQLQEENAKLREEMNELKKKQEFAGAGNRMSTNLFARRLFGNKKDKLDFDQTGA